jgi:hypothetical protein
MATMEIETRHRHYEALVQRVQTAASHPIHNSPVGNGVLNEYNRDGGSSHSASEKFNTSLPAVSEDSTVPEPGSNFLDTRYSTPSASPSTGTESWWSSPVLSSNGASNAMSRDTSSAGLARSRGPSTAPVLEMRIVDEDGVEGVRSFSPQLLETLEQAAAQKLESLNLSSKVISWLPESIGLVTNLTSLDLSGNDATKHECQNLCSSGRNDRYSQHYFASARTTS